MGKIFGTDGARGVANREITGILALQLGQAGARTLTETARHQPKLLIGRDPRASGDMLSSAIIAGICSVGAHAIDIGIVTTPCTAYLTRVLDVDAGVMISGSHNPVEDNGIKFFSHEGYKLSDELEERIEQLIFSEEPPPAPTGRDIGRLNRDTSAAEKYIDYLCSLMPYSLDGMHIALDCANGSASVAAPEVFQRLGAKVSLIHHTPDGLSINLNCGSTHPESLQAEVLRTGADIGFAFDGDADRVISVDEKGSLVDGDQMMFILGDSLKKAGMLKNNTLVATTMSNMGLEVALRGIGVKMLRTDVGDRYVLEEMLRGGYSLGGEQSGHIICIEQATTGDGIISALNIIKSMVEQKRPLSELAGGMRHMPQVLVNVPVSNARKKTLLGDLRLKARIDGIEESMRGTGRVIVRPSGTEALVRIMIEGENKAQIEAYANELAEQIMQV